MAAPTTGVAIYEHDAATILPLLVSHMPYSSSVLRRIQHGLAYPSDTAAILATFPAGATPEQPWLAARVDLFRGRETQMVIYSSLEAEHTSNAPIQPVAQSDGAHDSPDHHQQQQNADSQNNNNHIVSALSASPSLLAHTRAQLLALLSYVKSHLLPIYLSSLKESSAGPTTITTTGNGRQGVPLIPAPDPQAFLIGSLHTGLFSLLQRSGSYTDSDSLPGIKVHRYDQPPYAKYFFHRSAFSPLAGDAALPPGYRFHDRRGRTGVLQSQLDLVQSRTHIPRSKESLSTMPGVAMYCDDPSAAEKKRLDDGDEDEDEMPIAWGFIGTDGALATLHVEPEHRGRGLALLLAKEVMRRGMALDGIFGTGSLLPKNDQMQERVEEWVHTEVALYNKASQKVMEKIGGQVLTTVTWTVMELCD